jgi:DtxR family transcriptional regulator, Mn-dependent transcriptional regulator
MTTRRVNLNTESVDNYLKAIFALGGTEEARVTSTALAERLGVAPASVTNMLQKLAAASLPLVRYERHKGVRLSPAGRSRALEIVRHHRLLEAFLYEVLNYPIEEVHDEAERLEHFISERFEERIDVKLGRPKFDPHGHCIPALDGKMPKQNSMLLTNAGEGESFYVDSISDRDASTLKLLKDKGITPGKRLQVKRRNGDGTYVIAVGGSSKALSISHQVATAIRITG